MLGSRTRSSVLVSILVTVLVTGTSGGVANAQIGSWVQTNAGGAGAPSVRSGHVFVGGDANYAYLFGGQNGPLSAAQLWRYDHLTVTWTALPATGPAKRKFAASSFGAGNLVLFGGASGIGSTPYLGDTWSYSESAARWTAAQKCSSAHPCPSARTAAAMAYDRSRDYHLLYGGANSSATLGDTWIYTASTRRWTVAPTPAAGTAPSPRSLHAMTYVASIGQVVMFGGTGRDSLGANVSLADLWGWDGARWNPIIQNNSGPALSQMGMAYSDADARLVVFGGSTSPTINALTGNTWTFDFATGFWADLGSTVGLDPRDASPMAYLSRYGVRLFACGLSDGINGLVHVNDTWESR